MKGHGENWKIKSASFSFWRSALITNSDLCCDMFAHCQHACDTLFRVSSPCAVLMISNKGVKSKVKGNDDSGDNAGFNETLRNLNQCEPGMKTSTVPLRTFITFNFERFYSKLYF